MRWCILLLVSLVLSAVAQAGSPVRYRTYYPAVQQKVYIAESVLVPVIVPSTLLINLATQAMPPPVTIAPQLFLEAQQHQGLTLSRLEALERKLDQLLGQQGVSAAPVVPAKPTLVQAASVLRANCAQCHTGSAGRGEISLFNDQGEYRPNVPPSVIMAAIRSDRMPQGPNKLAPEHRALLEAWSKP